MSRHITSYRLTYKQNNVQRSTQDKNNTWKDRHSFTYVSTQKSCNALARRHINSNRLTHKSENNEQGRHRFYGRSTQFFPRSTHIPYRSTHMILRSTHMNLRSMHMFPRLTHKNNRSTYMNDRSTHVSQRLTHFNKNNNKQAWILKCLFNVLDTLKDLNRTK